MTGRRFCVCVPARDEAARLPVLLDALAAQTVPGPIAVALCLNNCADDSVAIVADAAARHTARLDIRIDECVLEPAVAHAGTARARAMDAGLGIVDPRGALISTDADCRPPPGWIAANLSAMEAGADIVGGMIVLDDADAVPFAMTAMRARYDRYWATVRAIEDAIDPPPHDPAPRHGDHTGASLAIVASLYRAVGGVPALACGEDRALVIAAVAAGGRLTHPTAVWTRVSARVDGRAAGGMATAMAALERAIAAGEEPRVAAYDHWRARAEWRRDERARAGTAAMLARERRLAPMPLDMPLPGPGA
ncbi:hypothetical protein ASG29_03850 [Sphingomonas sp. Leaf412]|uniref:glycosyltransferase n=1 Tax=Sphingomonas sp. Leaf412 TaxID=1736370 RepID=UPI000701D07A|nr:glycosyltransferase [Sphingomonas sp. Leaf412]KQT35251.1 hypothetical protein ASG29_03850 [Sphingomonas sp. Leaf412]